MAKFYTILFAALSNLFLFGTVLRPAFAQSLFESVWAGDGFVVLEWLRAEDQGVLYRSEVFITVTNNQLTVYNTFKQDPFGGLARCGGLGCDLERGDLIATLNFEPDGNRGFFVSEATGDASFMKGAVCQIEQSYLPVLVCYPQQGPNPSANLPSIIRFSPGT